MTDVLLTVTDVHAGYLPGVDILQGLSITARANAITQAWRDKTPITPLKIGYTVAEGLAAGNPGRGL